MFTLRHSGIMAPKLCLNSSKSSDSSTPVNCVVYDSFLPWALDVAKQHGINGAAFFTNSATVCSISAHTYHRPDMGHAINVLAPLVEKWKLVDDESKFYSSIDYSQPFSQMLKVW